jgi:hypothetical protein
MAMLHPIRKAQQEHSVPWFWPLAAAMSSARKGVTDRTTVAPCHGRPHGNAEQRRADRRQHGEFCLTTIAFSRPVANRACPLSTCRRVKSSLEIVIE